MTEDFNSDELKRMQFTHHLDQWRAGEAEYSALTYRIMMRDWRAKNLKLSEDRAKQLVIRYDVFAENQLEASWAWLAERGIQVDDDIANEALHAAHETLLFPTDEQYEAYITHLPDATKDKLRAEFEAGGSELWMEVWEHPIRLKPEFHAYFIGFLEGTDGLEELDY